MGVDEEYITGCETCGIEEYEHRQTCECTITLKCIICNETETTMERSNELYIEKRMEWMEWYGDWQKPICDDCDMKLFVEKLHKEAKAKEEEVGAIPVISQGSNETCGSWFISYTKHPHTGEVVTYSEGSWRGPPKETKKPTTPHEMALPSEAFLGGDDDHECDLCRDDQGYQLAKMTRPRILKNVAPQLLFMPLVQRQVEDVDIEWYRHDWKKNEPEGRE